MAETFGEKIRRARLRAGLTQTQVAQAVGLTQGYISKLERGEAVHPGAPVIRALAEVLNISAGELLESLPVVELDGATESEIADPRLRRFLRSLAEGADLLDPLTWAEIKARALDGYRRARELERQTQECREYQQERAAG